MIVELVRVSLADKASLREWRNDPFVSKWMFVCLKGSGFAARAGIAAAASALSSRPLDQASSSSTSEVTERSPKREQPMLKIATLSRIPVAN